MSGKRLVLAVSVVITVAFYAALVRDCGRGADAMAGTFNVRDYGAVGDGVTSDATAIALAKAAAIAAGGGTIYFPAGSYKTDALNLTSNSLSIAGAGRSLSTIVGTNGNTTVSIANATGNSISNITIQGPTTGGVPLYMTGAVNPTLTSVTVQNGETAGAYITLTHGLTATDLIVEDSAGRGLWLFIGVYNSTFTDTTVRDCVQDGIFLDAGTTGSGGDARAIHDVMFAGTTTVTNCASGTAAGAVGFSGAYQCVIENLIVTTTGNGNPGIAYQEDQNAGETLVGATRDNTVQRATLTTISGYGIYFGGSIRNTVGQVSITNLNGTNGSDGYAVYFASGQGGGDHICTDNLVAGLAVSQTSGRPYTYTARFESTDGVQVARNRVRYRSSGSPSAGTAQYAGTNAPSSGPNQNVVEADAPFLLSLAPQSGTPRIVR